MIKTRELDAASIASTSQASDFGVTPGGNVATETLGRVWEMSSVQTKQQKTPIQHATGDSPSAVDVWTVWYAAKHGKLARVRSLLDRQSAAVLDAQEYRTHWSPLHFACRYGHSAVVELLVGRGARLDLQDWQGNTPLHLSAGWGDLRCAVLVLEGGANPGCTNLAGQTPLDVATILARKDLSRVLQDWKPLGYTDEELAQFREQLVAGDSALRELEALLKEEASPQIRLELYALHSKRREFGESHAGLLATYGKLQGLYRDDAKLTQALDMADHGLTLCESLNGRHHVETARWVTALGELLLLQQNEEQAIHYLSEAHTTLTIAKGKSDPETLIALENLALACRQAGRLDTTEMHLRTLLELQTERFGGGYNATVFHLSAQLASVHLAQKQVEAARTLYADSLVHAENLFGATDEETVACCDALAKCCFLMGDFEEAEKHFKRSLDALLHRPGIAASSSHIPEIHKLSAVSVEPLDSASRMHFRRTQSNLAMVAVAARSAAATRRQLQLLGYR